jgi:phosphomannomutase
MRRKEHADCLFAGEHSGHYFLRGFYLADSAMSVALMLIEATLDLGPRGLQDRLDAWRKKYFTSDEVNFDVRKPQANRKMPEPDQRKLMQQLVERVRMRFGGNGTIVTEYAPGDPIKPSNGVDILKIEGKETAYDWWICVRPSGNEPILRLIVENILKDKHVGKMHGGKLLKKNLRAAVDLMGRKYMVREAE